MNSRVFVLFENLGVFNEKLIPPDCSSLEFHVLKHDRYAGGISITTDLDRCLLYCG